MVWQNLYENPRLYDKICRNQEDVHFYLERALKADGPVLEICSGTGRITLPIAKAGVAITGLDLSSKMMRRAKQKAKKERLFVEWIESDMRTFSLRKRFSLIFVAFNSIHHNSDELSLTLFFKNVKKHLKPGGHLIFDTWNPLSTAFNKTSSEEKFEVNRFQRMKNKISEGCFNFLYSSEIKFLLKRVGLRHTEILGDMNGNPYKPESHKMIFVCSHAARY